MSEVTLRVVKEDMAIVENLNPVRTPDTNTREVLVPGDTAIAAYHGVRLEEMGREGLEGRRQGAEREAGRLRGHDPLPARRTEGNWVQEAVPLVPGTASASRHAS